MKRLPMTPQLIAQIKAAVGEDVDPEGFAVFEVIAINSLPLPGKDGSIFEKAQVTPLTLRQMVDSIEGGNSLPLILNHDMSGLPVGRVFAAQLNAADTGEIEMRSLFYIDNTNAELADKVDAGSLDEVSVGFLASQLLCSECGWDYRGEDADWSNFSDRTCDNDHTIGKDGVHLNLVGLQTFSELSLVTRGAASKPKIVGKSASKLAAPLQALAARGFEIDELYCTASKGEYEVDINAVLSQLTEQTSAAATATAQLTVVTGERDALQTELAARDERITALEAAAAEAPEVPEAAELEAAQADLTAAQEVLVDIYTKLAVAAGSDVPAPESIADLKAGIDELQSKLTALIPVGGAAANTQNDKGDAGSQFNAAAASAFVTPR
jgi:hypothetical protein